MPQTGGATSPCPICGLFFHPEALAAHADSCASRAYGDGVYTTRHSANRRPARSPDALPLCVRALLPSPSPRPRSARSTDEIAIRSFPIPLPLSHAVESNPRRSGTPPPSPTRTPSMNTLDAQADARLGRRRAVRPSREAFRDLGRPGRSTSTGRMRSSSTACVLKPSSVRAGATPSTCRSRTSARRRRPRSPSRRGPRRAGRRSGPAR